MSLADDLASLLSVLTLYPCACLSHDLTLAAGQATSGKRLRAQKLPGQIELWCNLACLSINPSKSTVVIFLIATKLFLHIVDLLSMLCIVKTTVKYLEVLMDTKLTWSSHLSNTIIAVNIQQANLNQSPLVSRHWGLNSATI